MIDIECSVFIYSSGTGLEKKKNRKNRKQWESDLWPNIIFGDWTLVVYFMVTSIFTHMHSSY